MTVTELPLATIRVVVLADEPIVRASLRQMLVDAPGLDLVASVGHATDLSRWASPSGLPPTVVVAWSSSEPLAQLQALEASGVTRVASVVFVAPDAAGPLVERAVAAEVRGFLSADCSPDDLVAAVRSAAAGYAPFSPAATRHLLTMTARQSTARGLTEREQEVLGLVADGMLNKQIARRLGIAESTVKVHLGRIYAQIGVDNRARAALWARSSGFGAGRIAATG